MAEYKDNTIVNKIVDSNNIVDVIGEYINLEHKGKNFFGVCPFHDDHSPSMSVSPEKGIYKCFSCGASGNAITFLIEYLGITFKEAIKILADNANIKLDDNFIKKKNNPYEEYYKINDLVVSIFKNNLMSQKGKEAREYLDNRSLDEEVIKYFDIGLSINEELHGVLLKKYDKSVLNELDLCKVYENKVVDTFINRIMFPIKDIDGNVLGFTGRIYKEQDKGESKYLNTKETTIFRKGLILYNLNNAKEFIRKQKEIIISEGQMDTIRLHTIGINNAISLSGTSITKEQVDIIANFKCDIVLNLDQDEAGKTATNTIGTIFENLGLKVKVVVFDKAKDTDELIVKEGKEAFISAYNNKVDFINFKLDYLKRNKNLNDSVELSKYINEALDNLNKLNDEVLVELKIKELSDKYGISESILRNKITKKVPIKKIENKNLQKVRKYNKYEKVELRIIYLMLENNDVILTYENNLGFLITDEMTSLANEIVDFKIKNKGFNESEFITHTYTIDKMNDSLKEVMLHGGPSEYSEEELEDLILQIKKQSVKREMEKLKNKLKESLDIEEKKRLLKRIENMKKEVLTW